MDNNLNNVPVVLSYSSNDPSGGAGIQADIETLGALGCHCCPIITALTTQDTTQVYSTWDTPSQLILSASRRILEDMPVAAIKIGFIGSAATARAIHTILSDYPSIPVILDPSITCGNESYQAQSDTIDAILGLIMPKTTLCIANQAEARQLGAQGDTIDACAQQLMDFGANYVLITGHVQGNNKIAHYFYSNFRRLETFLWPRISKDFHGAGSTLTAAATGILSQGLEMFSAVHQAQEYVAECLKHAYRPGMGAYVPNRLLWSREADFEYDARKSG